MPLEAHYDRFVLKCGSCGEELTKPGRMAPLPEAAAAGWGLIVEPNGMYDYACSACLAKPRIERTQAPDEAAGSSPASWAGRRHKLVPQRVIDFDQN
jgi:hypothetical protein